MLIVTRFNPTFQDYVLKFDYVIQEMLSFSDVNIRQTRFPLGAEVGWN